uniref:Cytochrome P450 n=1 Tax=Quercus lobata TaxID=97700 RepID=A0A7N2LL34_QUELO
MDFFSNLLHLVLLCISTSLIFLIYKQNSTRAKFPPGIKGWPVIGETLEFGMAGKRGTPETFINDRMSKYSQELFKTSLFCENMAVFCGASGNKFLFSNENKYVISWLPPFLLKGVLPESLKNFSPEDSIKIRRAVVEFLMLETLQYFIPIMDSMAKKE